MLDIGTEPAFFFFFFFNDTATTEIYTLSLHDALPISCYGSEYPEKPWRKGFAPRLRSEEHTSELQSQSNLVCRLLLEKKKIYESVTPRPLRVIGTGASTTL